MGVRKVHLIAIEERYLETITKQVKEVLGDKILIEPRTLKNLQVNTVLSGEMVVLSSNLIKGLVMELIPEDCPCIIAKRDINYANTEELLSLTPGKSILVFNDNKKNTEETIHSLRNTFFEHTYIPYSPENPIPKTIDYIITPGERHLLPGGLKNVIDIGPRLLDISTFEELLNLLDIKEEQSQLVKRYLKALVSLSLNLKSNLQEETNSFKDIRDVAQYRFEDIVAVSEPMKKVVTLAKKYAKGNNIIHIEGEPGTGKSMLAQAIHNHSFLSYRPFISIDCASRDYETIEKELFGSEDGEGISQGFLELAGNGTICIKEIGELPYLLQARIYSVLREGKFSRFSGRETITLHARVITTNTRDCKKLVEDGLFYPDLYNLLSAISIKVPSLSERKEDLLPLMEDVRRRIKRSNIHFTSEVINYLASYKWRGNVKELYNVITHLSFLEEETIDIHSLPFYLRPNEKAENLMQVLNPELDTKELVSKIEEHGFLEENIEILKAFLEGKKERTSFGRLELKKRLAVKGIYLSEQQLRMRLEVLQELDLLLVRQGRAGSTISRRGEEFLKYFA